MSTPTEHRIRAAAPADVPAIVGLIKELADFEKLGHLAQATPETLMPHLFGDKPVVECWVAEGDGQDGQRGLIAFALFFTNFSTFLAKPGLYLEDLYVQPAHRGTGLGKEMLSRLAALAVQRGYGRFEWSVLDWNVNAIEFYKKMGAVLMDDWRICRLTGDALAQYGR